MNFNQKYSIKSINNQFSEMALNPQQIRLKTKILSNGILLTQQIVSLFNKTEVGKTTENFLTYHSIDFFRICLLNTHSGR